MKFSFEILNCGSLKVKVPVLLPGKLSEFHWTKYQVSTIKVELFLVNFDGSAVEWIKFVLKSLKQSRCIGNVHRDAPIASLKHRKPFPGWCFRCFCFLSSYLLLIRWNAESQQTYFPFPFWNHSFQMERMRRQFTKGECFNKTWA